MGLLVSFGCCSLSFIGISKGVAMTRAFKSNRKHTSVLPVERHGVDSFTVELPPGEVYQGCLLTFYESDRHSGAKVIAQPPRGAPGTQEITVEWWHGSGDKVSYQLEAFTQPADAPPDSPSPTRQLTGFVPEQHGFHFPNAFPAVPDITISIPLGRVEFGDASNGLCGGMVFCALDYFLAKRPVPATNKPPSAGDLFDGFVRRLLNSFNLPLGILNYIVLMNPDYPDGDDDRVSGKVFAPHGRAWQTVRVEWPIIKAMLDAGQPCPLGLVRVKATELSKLGHNHQVLATGYEVTDDILTLFLYDPNYPDRNDVSLSLSLSAPDQPTPIKFSMPNDLPVYAFFHVQYKFRSPPAVS
jgi:hypothetical protein